MENITKHNDIVLEMVNDKIMDIYREVHDGDGDIPDDEELDQLCRCVKIKAKLAKIKCIEHEMRRSPAGIAAAMKHAVEKTL